MNRLAQNDKILFKNGNNFQRGGSAMVKEITQYTFLDWIAIIGFLLTALGLVLTIISVIKIQKVKDAQKEAQDRYAELVRVKEIEQLLYDLQNFFKRLQSNSKIPENVKQHLNIADYSTEITSNIATIEAINRAFNTAVKNQINTVQGTQLSSPQYVPNGYYNVDFFNNIILKAQTKILICCKRNTRVCTQGNVQKLCKLANSGCEITIVSISPKMSDDLLEEIRTSVPNPPKTVKKLRDSQVRNREQLLENARNSGASSLKYYETLKFPFFHLIQVDDRVYWGLVNYTKHGEDTSQTYEDRPYLIFDQNDPFIEKMLQKVDDIIRSSEHFEIINEGEIN